MSRDTDSALSRRSMLKKTGATAAVAAGGATLLSGTAAADSEVELVIESEGGRGEYEIEIDDGTVEKRDFEWYDDNVDDQGDHVVVSGQVSSGWSGSNEDVYIYQGEGNDSDITVIELDDNVDYHWE